MRKLLASFCLLAASSVAALAQPETIESRDASLSGLWRIALPAGFGTNGVTTRFEPIRESLVATVTGISPPAFGQMADAYCRISPLRDELEMSCIETGVVERVTLKEGRVRIGDSRITFEGEQLDAAHLRGHFRSSSWLGVSSENPAIAQAVRISPQTDAPDKTGKAPLLRRILEQGLAAAPQDADAMKKNDSILTLPALGAVESLSYLGQETKWDWPPPPGVKADRMHIPSRPDFFSVYFVRFAEGERLCGLHQRDDGVLDAFRCV